MDSNGFMPFTIIFETLLHFHAIAIIHRSKCTDLHLLPMLGDKLGLDSY